MDVLAGRRRLTSVPLKIKSVSRRLAWFLLLATLTLPLLLTVAKAKEWKPRIAVPGKASESRRVDKSPGTRIEFAGLIASTWRWRPQTARRTWRPASDEARQRRDETAGTSEVGRREIQRGQAS